MKTILLIDDDRGIQLLFSEELKDDGYTVVSAFDGEEGLRLFQENPPDLVILDIQMPRVNGIEVLRQMKSMNASIPVILSSAYHEYKRDLCVWACDEYIVKSSDMTELKQAVKKYIG